MASWRGGPQGPRNEPDDERILARRDIDQAILSARKDKDPLASYPALANYLAARGRRLAYQLQKDGLDEDDALRAAREANRTAVVAALAMHRAIWRDLLPRPGVAGQVWSQLPLDLPPENPEADGDAPF
ncbi:MAG: hypothetical protein R3B68_11225 [Phycisphaerales bacterium]